MLEGVVEEVQCASEVHWLWWQSLVDRVSHEVAGGFGCRIGL